MFDNLLKLFLAYSAEIIPAFLFAILISAILAETLPESFFEKVLSSKGIAIVFLSSVIGALIPLCTCGMIPLASKLQKRGTSWLIVLSFLTSGNASSITALFMTLVLGWKITVYRFLFSVVFGITVAYIFVLFFNPAQHQVPLQNEMSSQPHLTKIFKEFVGLFFSFGPWILAAIFIASIINLFLKPDDIASFTGSKNLFSPFLLEISSFPFYFCAGSDVPISKALLEKGASIGNILTFMAASPSINLTSFFLYQKWLGLRNSATYLAVSFLVCGMLGLVVNLLLLK